MYKYENEKSYRGDQNLNITKGAVPAFSLSIQRLCYVIGNIYLITTLTLVISLVAGYVRIIGVNSK